MEVKPKEDLSPLEQMPIDVLSYALAFIPDKETLRFAIRSCRAIHDAFKHRKAYIASSVLFRAMDEGVYQECVVAFNLKLQKWQGADAGIEAISRVFKGSRSIDREHLTFAQVQEMWRVQRSVEYFTNRIATSLKAKHSSSEDDPNYRITSRVLSRFQRAVYRLNMYTTVSKAVEGFQSYYYAAARSKAHSQVEKQDIPLDPTYLWYEQSRLMKSFHGRFSVVEVEQMNCICEFLITAIAPIFNNFLEADIDLGSEVPCYIDNEVSPIGMKLIKEGLPFLFSFATGSRHEAQSKVIREAKTIDWAAVAFEQVDIPDNDEQLCSAVEWLDLSGRPWFSDDQPFSETLLRTPFYDDGDRGPENAWKQGGAVAEAQGSVTWEEYQRSKRRGYVFWDCPTSNDSEIVDFSEGAFRCGRLPESLEHLNGRDPVQYYWESFHRWDLAALDKLEATYEEKIVLKSEGKTGFFHFELFGCENTADANIDSDFLDDDDYIAYD